MGWLPGARGRGRQRGRNPDPHCQWGTGKRVLLQLGEARGWSRPGECWGCWPNGPRWGRQGTLRQGPSSSGGGHRQWMGWRSPGLGPSPTSRRSLFFHSVGHLNILFNQTTFADTFGRPEPVRGPGDMTVTRPSAAQMVQHAACKACCGQRRHRSFLEGQKEEVACQGGHWSWALPKQGKSTILSIRKTPLMLRPQALD